MNLVKYFTHQYRILIYATLAAVFALLIANLTHQFFLPNIAQLFSVFVILLYIMRTHSDIRRYAANRRSHKKQFISKNHLYILIAVLSIAYLLLNIIFYQRLGFFALLPLGLIFIWNTIPFCKIIFLPLVSMIYFFIYGGAGIFNYYEAWLYLIILLLISIGVYCYQRGKK